MTSLQTEASLIVATMDLAVVQMLRQAIRTADLSQAGSGGSSFAAGAAATYEPRRHIHPEPLYEPRPRIHPLPRYEARPIIHVHPRIEQQALDCPRQTPVSAASKPENSIQPPWKMLPQENPLQPCQPIKVHRHHTDVTHKGMMLDLFV